MKLEELYTRNVKEELNGVVSTGDMTPKTVKTEIDEYVFTADIVNGLYKTLEAIKNGSVNHNGVWVSGYFGSGKSHFLKYLCYCLRNMGDALNRMTEAVKENDPLNGGKSSVAPNDWKTVAAWLVTHGSSVRTIIFNMGESGDSNVKAGDEFLTVFWRKFNEMRGYSGTDLALAFFLERPLDKAGKFQAFKDEIASKGFNWDNDRTDLAGTMLDTVLAAAKAAMPELTADAVRENIIQNKISLSVANFMDDVKAWVEAQGTDCRLVFCVDEISQYIGNSSRLLLQLQEIVSAFHDKCGAKVWLVCTAQQDLSEIASESGLNQTSEEYGKIMGRFPVMVQLAASSTEFITRKRVLAKTPPATIELGKYYDAHKNEIDSQYTFPAAYPVYADRNDFIDTYPFLGCHFRLMGQVLRAFRTRGFVVQNVKDNARSVLTVTLDVARATREAEVGKFISFDEFFSQNLKGGLTAFADSVIRNARALADKRPDPAFATRVLNVLFMVCHLDPRDAKAFPATIDNLTSLMMSDLATSRKTLRDRIETEVNHLCDNSVLMRETNDAGVEHFKFYSKTESEIDFQIKAIIPGTDDMAGEWDALISERLGSELKNKASFHAAKVSVGMDILGRHFLSPNADVNIDMRVNSGGVALGQFKLGNPDTTLAFFMNDLYNAAPKFREALELVCKFNMFSRNNALNSADEKAALEVFRDHAKRLRTTCLIPAIDKFLLKAPVISAQTEIATSPTSSPAMRFAEARDKHLESLYPKAAIADPLPHTATALAEYIRAWSAPPPGTPLSDPEQAVDDYLSGFTGPCTVTSVVDYFKKRPYGWDENATLAALFGLVAVERRQFIYNGKPDPARETIAADLSKKQSSFSITSKAEIPPQTVEDFLDAMRDLFGPTTLSDASPQAGELAKEAKEFLSDKTDEISKAKGDAGPRPFVEPLDAMLDKFNDWKKVADVKDFFDTVAAEAAALKGDWDCAKEAMDFVNGQQWEKYIGILDFAARNAENSQFLDQAGKTNFGYLADAKDDMKPWSSNLVSWMKIRAQLEAAFDACRAEKDAKIEQVYADAFDELAEMARNLCVAEPTAEYRAEIIAGKKSGDSLMSRENAINSVGNFKADEMQKIIASKPIPAAQAGGPQSSAAATATAPSASSVKIVKLAVSQTAPLATEAEVDAYLARLKTQLMAEISGGVSVIVQ